MKSSVPITSHSEFAAFLLGGLAAWREFLRLSEPPTNTPRAEPHRRERTVLRPTKRCGH
jgi:hypothetical protein